MKKSILLLAVGVMSLSTMAQSSETVPGDSIPWELRKQSFIYNSAKMFSDPLIAKVALYNLIAENPGNVALYDSLALIYLQYNQNASAALVAQQALLINPNDMFATEIAATGFDKLGVKDRAITYYEKMYLESSDVNTLYKISFMQYELERYTEANTSLDIVIGDPRSKQMENAIRFPSEDGAGQEVSLEAAAMRVKAMVLEAQGDIEGAKAKYLEVLGMKPGFEIVQKQLRALSQATKGE